MRPIKLTISAFGPYAKETEIILDELGERGLYLITGDTGAGKTTLMNLLLRFYDVNGGSIKIDGIDIRDMDRSDLRSLFSLVLQDTWLFSGSIFENIRYGSLTARKDEVVDAAKNGKYPPLYFYAEPWL